MKYLILLFAIQVQAVDITPYVHCRAEQDQLLKETRDTSTSCKTKISEAARCCTGSMNGCTVAPISVSGNSGTQDSGQAQIKGDSANVTVIKRMQEKCENVSHQVAVACNNSPADKADARKYILVAGRLNKCLDERILESQARVQTAGAVIQHSEDQNARNQRCNAQGFKSEQDIIRCMIGK